MKRKSVQSVYGTVSYWVSDTWDSSALTLFFMHGLALDHTVFNDQVKALQDDYNVIAWDAPGHGRSEYGKPVCMDELVEVVYQIVQAEGVEGFVAVGQSYGCYVAQAFMDEYPDLVSGFMGIAASPYGEKFYTEADFKSRAKAIARGKYVPWVALRTVAAITATATSEGYERMLSVLSRFEKKSYIRIMQDYEYAFRKNNHDISITCPVVLICGGQDTIGNVSELCDAWHEETGFMLIIIPEAGHIVQLDCSIEATHQIDVFARTFLE